MTGREEKSTKRLKERKVAERCRAILVYIRIFKYSKDSLQLDDINLYTSREFYQRFHLTIFCISLEGRAKRREGT